MVAMAQPGEQVEAVVSRGRDTEIKAYGGEIESLSSAQSQGVGIRVIAEGRQGFAYAATFDADVLAETLVEARDNAGFGTPDEFLGLAEPDGVAVADLALFDEALESFPTDRKVDLAIELERATLAADPRISGIESAEYVDVLAEGAIVTNTGIRTLGRETACYVMTYVMATEADETQTGFGFSVGRQPGELDVATAASDAAGRATRMLGAVKPGSERLTVVLDPWVTAQFLGILAFTLNGEAVLKGRSLFADRLGDEVAVAGGHPGRRSHQPRGVHRDRDRRRRTGDPPQLTHRGRRPAHVRAQRLHRPAGGHDLHRVGRPQRVQEHARGRLHGHLAAARSVHTGRARRPGR